MVNFRFDNDALVMIGYNNNTICINRVYNTVILSNNGYT